jgi:adenine-specific DNA-methyltransferase
MNYDDYMYHFTDAASTGPRYRELQQHFTYADDINSAMCALLGSVDNRSLLEPCVGEGALLQNLTGSPSKLTCFDIDDRVLSIAKRTISVKGAEFHCKDFLDLLVPDTLFDSSIADQYDAVIANPPYGLYLDKQFRKYLKALYPSLYVRESFGLFFVLAIRLLKQGGRYVFLLPDTFLSSTNHKSLRRFIADHAAPSNIIRFPAKRFGSVNFGYGNLCIIAGTRSSLTPGAHIEWSDVFDDNSSIRPTNARTISSSTLLETVSSGWFAASADHGALDREQWTDLGSIADCRTGIYTGDNTAFLGYDSSRVHKRLNGHPIDWATQVTTVDLTQAEKVHGITAPACYVPIVRGGHRGCFENTPWAIKWNPDAVSYYRHNGKARLQNSKYYFRPGISVPMVSTKKISAAVMTHAIFDQGVVGVFPTDERLRDSLLLYLNSDMASQKMKEIVNGSANNSANYLKRLPVPMFSPRDLLDATKLLGQAERDGALKRELCNAFSEAAVRRITT